ncbi:hypothetical protein DBR06_SOUSAS17010009, partial [Sousa chinensis]
FLTLVLYFAPVLFRNLVSKSLLLQRALHMEDIGLQRVFGSHPVPLGLILILNILVLFSLTSHLPHFLLAQPALVIGDGDLVSFACAPVSGCHTQDATGINVRSHLDLGDSTWGRRDAPELKASQPVVVPSHGPLTLIHLDQ